MSKNDSSSRPSLGFMHGIRTVPRAWQLLKELPRVLWLLLIPLALTAVLDGLAFYYGYGWLRQRILAEVPHGSLGQAVRSTLSLVSGIVVVVLLAWTFSFVYLLLCELVVDSVSEAVEERVTGHAGSAQSISNKLRSVGQSLIQAVLLWGAGLGSWLLGFIPLVGPVATLMCSTLMLGYGFFSISAGRKAQSLGQRWQLARTQSRAVMGLGLVAFVTNLIPVVNLLALPVFVVAGTLLYLDSKQTS